MATPLRESPEWWRDRLLVSFEAQLRVRESMLKVYEGMHPLPTPLAKKYKDELLPLIRASRTPWGRMVVDTTAERLQFQGFSVAGDGADDVVWNWMQSRNVDRTQQRTYRDAMGPGVGYISVWPSREGTPMIRRESPLETHHEFKAGSTDEVAAAIKMWPDTVREIWRCDLYTEQAVYSWQAQWVDGADFPRGSVWRPVEGVSMATHKLGMVPIVPFVGQRDAWGLPKSDLADLMPLFDRFELVTADMLVASSFAAFRQKWASGLEIPVDPTTGEPVEPFKQAIDRLWVSEDPDTKFGTLDATDLTPYVRVKDAIVAEIAAISRVPSSYFVQSELANPPSAQALEAAEANLISKVKERQVSFGGSWERVVALALRAAGDDRAAADLASIETLWKDPRTRSESQVLDAASKMKDIGVPWEEVMLFIGFSPDKVQTMKAQRMAEALMQGFTQAVAQPGQPQEQQPADAGPA